MDIKIENNLLVSGKGRGTDDGVFVISQNVDKRNDAAFGFVHLEKAFGTVPREQAFVVMR